MRLSAEVLIERINKGVLLDCDKVLNSQFIKQFERDMLADAADRAIAFEKVFTTNLDPVISYAYFSDLRAEIMNEVKP